MQESIMSETFQQLAAGDTVKVELEVAVLKLMQEEHGGWNDTMTTVSQEQQ